MHVPLWHAAPAGQSLPETQAGFNWHVPFTQYPDAQSVSSRHSLGSSHWPSLHSPPPHWAPLVHCSCSSAHEEEQPSPLRMLPSSHRSGDSRRPFPQSGVARTSGSFSQYSEHPSPPRLLPSSQTSPVSMLPLPHCARIQSAGEAQALVPGPGMGTQASISQTVWVVVPQPSVWLQAFWPGPDTGMQASSLQTVCVVAPHPNCGLQLSAPSPGRRTHAWSWHA